MKKITAVLLFYPQPGFERMVQFLMKSPLIEKVMILKDASAPAWPLCDAIEVDSLTSGRTWNALLSGVRTEYVLVVDAPHEIVIAPGSLERFVDVAEATEAGMVYADFLEERDGLATAHPLNDYQLGSIREGFDFGPVMLFSTSAVVSALGTYGAIADWTYAGIYDLRLKVSIEHPLFHIQECLYTSMIETSSDSSQETHFSYVDPQNQAAQKEMEEAATEHLKHIGAWLKPACKKASLPAHTFPVHASVIIPVRNRVRTISDAIESALAQETNFLFNVIVVDNHSTDGTADLVFELARHNTAIKRIIPARLDLSIGGCWNEAVASADCGRYAVQLDSDDLYSSPDTLQKITDLFCGGNYAMVIGAYTIVDESLREIPPGLINHREWSDAN